jgi:hypothetical protein|nr:MAG TPA: tail protein [Bacteriophage sp.]
MGAFYREGEVKTRPGVYKRYDKMGSNPVASAIDGVGAIVVQADWGPVGTVTQHNYTEGEAGIKNVYGTGGNISTALQMFSGGLTKLYIVRVNGSDGAQGKVTLNSGETEAVELTLKYPGTRAFAARIKVSAQAADDSVKELSVLEIVNGKDPVVRETIKFAAKENEVAALVSAVNEQSNYINAKAQGDASGVLDIVEKALFAGGANPTPAVDNYSEAFALLDAYPYQTICLDTTDKDTQDTLKEHIAAVKAAGKMKLAVLGSAENTSLEDRMKAAKSYNSAQIVYFGGSYKDSNGNVVVGAPAIAKVAGIIASTPANRSIVHKVVTGAASATEAFSDAQYTEAIQNGLLLLSTSADGTIWFDSGVNTLVTPAEDEDDGWKKIRRTKTRIELMDRLDRQLEKLVGNVDCDTDGIANCIQQAQLVIDSMVNEKKLISGTFAVDDTLGYDADYANFKITVIDKDSLEKIYLHYQFQYSTKTEA